MLKHIYYLGGDDSHMIDTGEGFKPVYQVLRNLEDDLDYEVAKQIESYNSRNKTTNPVPVKVLKPTPEIVTIKSKLRNIESAVAKFNKYQLKVGILVDFTKGYTEIENSEDNIAYIPYWDVFNQVFGSNTDLNLSQKLKQIIYKFPDHKYRFVIYPWTHIDSTIKNLSYVEIYFKTYKDRKAIIEGPMSPIQAIEYNLKDCFKKLDQLDPEFLALEAYENKVAKYNTTHYASRLMNRDLEEVNLFDYTKKRTFTPYQDHFDLDRVLIGSITIEGLSDRTYIKRRYSNVDIEEYNLNMRATRELVDWIAGLSGKQAKEVRKLFRPLDTKICNTCGELYNMYTEKVCPCCGAYNRHYAITETINRDYGEDILEDMY